MNEWLEVFAAGMMRTTLVTSGAALLALVLLALLRVRNARTHRLAWLLVIAQGWLLVPCTLSVEVAHQPKPPTTQPSLEPTMASPVVATPIDVHRLPPKAPAAWLRPIHAAVGLWLTGVVALIVMAARRYAKIACAGPLGQPVDQPEWADEWATARACSTVRGSAELRISEHLGPLVCWVPRVFLVLVPRTLWQRLTSSDRLAILRHELAHCERGDLWKNLAVRLLALPQWFNPLVWLALRRFEEAGEWACDEQVAQAMDGASTDYASTLLRVADYAAAVPCGAVAATGGELSRRVKRLLHLPSKEVREMRGLVLPLLLVGVGLLQVIRFERVVAHEPDEPIAKIEATDLQPPKSKWNFDQPYVIEPPDVLLVSDCKLSPKPGYKLRSFDGLLIRTEDEVGIDDAYFVSPEGDIDLGPEFDTKCQVVGLTLSEAATRIRKLIQQLHPKSEVAVALSVMGSVQEVVGKHLVGPDGKIDLGDYGSVYVAGMTLDRAAEAIKGAVFKSSQATCSSLLVDVFATNSKKYYVITKGDGGGDNIVSAAVTGNETVLDAIAAIGGLKQASDTKIWVARPAPNGVGEEQILPVDFEGITGKGDTSTNHQLYPGDRVFIEDAEHSTPPVGIGVNSDAGVVEKLLLENRPTGGAPLPQAVPAEPYAPAAPPQEAPAGYYRPTPAESPAATPDYYQPGSSEPTVKATIRFIRDPKFNLRNVDGLRTGSATIGHTHVLLGLLRVLEKNELAKILAAPTVTAKVGEKMTVSVGADEWLAGGKPSPPNSEQRVRVELVSEGVGTEARFYLRASIDKSPYAKQRQYHTGTPPLNVSESFLVRIPEEMHENDAPDLYLMVSRELVPTTVMPPTPVR